MKDFTKIPWSLPKLKEPLATHVLTFPEGIDLKSSYDLGDIKFLKLTQTLPGNPPFIRGP